MRKFHLLIVEESRIHYEKYMRKAEEATIESKIPRTAGYLFIVTFHKPGGRSHA
jgi:hypothetical protein